jgi:hypothetical protein
MMNDVLKRFKDLGRKASYHYADDTGTEWGEAKRLENEARQLFADNPDLQDELEAIAKGFLWRL